MKDFVKSILAGVMISLGGLAFLQQESKICGAFLFSIGLIAVILFGYNLFTGKVCNKDYLCAPVRLIKVYIGNLIGTLLSAVLLWSHGSIVDSARAVADAKMGKPLFNVFIDSVVCGICIAIAVKGYARTKSFIPVILGVMVFILASAEHVVADMFYFLLAHNTPLVPTLLFFGVVTIGNILGGAIFATENV